MRDRQRQRLTSDRAGRIRRAAEKEVRLFQKQDEPPTFSEIGKRLGISRKLAERTYKSAIAKLRNALIAHIDEHKEG